MHSPLRMGRTVTTTSIYSTTSINSGKIAIFTADKADRMSQLRGKRLNGRMKDSLNFVDEKFVAAPLGWDMLELSSRFSNKESLP